MGLTHKKLSEIAKARRVRRFSDRPWRRRMKGSM